MASQLQPNVSENWADRIFDSKGKLVMSELRKYAKATYGDPTTAAAFVATVKAEAESGTVEKGYTKKGALKSFITYKKDKDGKIILDANEKPIPINTKMANRLARLNALPANASGEDIFNIVYDDATRTDNYKLGNTEAGDGYKYRGRGLIQITGKDKYKKLGDRLGVDLVANPDLLDTDKNLMLKATNLYLNDKNFTNSGLTSNKLQEIIGHNNALRKGETKTPAQKRWADAQTHYKEMYGSDMPASSQPIQVMSSPRPQMRPVPQIATTPSVDSASILSAVEEANATPPPIVNNPQESNDASFTQPPPQLQQPIIKEEPLMKMQYLADGTEEVIPPYILDAARPRVPSQLQMTPPVIQEFSAPTVVTEAPPPPVQTTPAEPMVRPSGGFGSNIEYDYAAYLRETGYNDVPAVREMFRRYMDKMNARSFTYGANTNPKLFGDNKVGFSESPEQLAVPSIDYGYPVLSEQPMAMNRNAPYPIAPMSTGGGFNPQTRSSYDSASMMEINNPLGEGMSTEPTVPAVQQQVTDPRNLGGSEGYGPYTGYGQNVPSSNVLDYNPRNTGEAAFQLQTEQNLNDKLYTDRLKLQREIERLEGAAITPYDFERLQKMKDQLVTMGGSTIENPKTDQLLEAENNYNESIIDDRNDATMSTVSRDRRIANDTVIELEKTLATADPAFKPLIEIRLNEARAALEKAENAFNYAQANLETVPLNTETNVPPINKKVVVDDPAMDNRENVIYDLELNNGAGLNTGKDANNNTVIINKKGKKVNEPTEEEIDKTAKGLGTDTNTLLGSLGPIFKSLFGLETQDMTRALGFYLMSRASGASHAGSMRWAGGTVLKQAEARGIRNDAKTDAAIKAFAGVKNTYTTAAASKINKLLSEGKLLEAQTVMSDPKSKTFRGRYGIDADDAGTPMMRPGSTKPVLIFTGTDGQVFKKITVDGKEGFVKVSTEEYTSLRERAVGDNRSNLRDDLESAITNMNSTLFRQAGTDKDTKEPYEGGMFGGQDQQGVIAAIMKKSDELGALGLDNIPTDILDRFVNIAELAESQGIKKINPTTLLDMIYVGGQGLVNTEKLTTDDGEMLTSSQIGSFTDAFKEMFPGIKGQPNYSAIQSTFAAAEANADTGLFSTVKGVTEVAKASTEPKLTAAQIKKISSMPNVYTASVLFEAFKLQSKKIN